MNINYPANKREDNQVVYGGVQRKLRPQSSGLPGMTYRSSFPDNSNSGLPNRPNGCGLPDMANRVLVNWSDKSYKAPTGMPDNT